MTMAIGFHPFNNGPAIDENKLYNAYLKRPDDYWKSMCKKIRTELSPEFIELANSMIRHDGDQRATVREILDSAWFQVNDQLDAKAVLDQLQREQKEKTAAALAAARTADEDDDDDE